MVGCDYCSNKIEELPRPCSYCHCYFCTTHRLPESHDCHGLKKGNVFRGTKTEESHKRKKHHHEVNEPYKREYVGTPIGQSILEKSKSYIKRKYYRTRFWLNSKRQRGYSNWNAFFMNFLWIVILSVFLMIIYSNLSKLNEIVLWFLPLGGSLLLVTAFFWLKFCWNLLKRIYYWYNGERNWVKYLTLIVLLLLLWQGYQNRSTLFDGVIEQYDKMDFSSILPLGISEDIPEDSIFSKRSVENIKENIVQEIDPDSEKNMQRMKEENMNAFTYLNNIRRENNVPVLKWDDRVYILGIARVKDMHEYNYMDHTNPETGSCPDNIKKKYGLNYDEYVAENAYGMQGADAEPIAAIDSWMTSRGHRYNLLYSTHTGGAVACYRGYCVFLGLNYDGFGEGCHTGEEGMAFWNSVGKQPGEI